MQCQWPSNPLGYRPLAGFVAAYAASASAKASDPAADAVNDELACSSPSDH
jgi:hypothetical protein